MSLSESLSVVITADSSSLQSALEGAGERVGRLHDQLGQLGPAVARAAQSFSQFASATHALNSVSQAASQAMLQLQQLSQTPVTLNVSGALGALAALSATIAAVATQLSGLSGALSGGFGGGGPTRVGIGLAAGGSVGHEAQGHNAPWLQRAWPHFDQGGLVRGPTGHDRVPAWLTNGEFVVQGSAVDWLGRDFLERLNTDPAQIVLDRSNSRRIDVPPDGPPGAAGRPAFPLPVANEGPSVTTQHFGEVHVQVQQPFDWRDLVRTISAEATNLRMRRG